MLSNCLPVTTQSATAHYVCQTPADEWPRCHSPGWSPGRALGCRCAQRRIRRRRCAVPPAPRRRSEPPAERCADSPSADAPDPAEPPAASAPSPAPDERSSPDSGPPATTRTVRDRAEKRTHRADGLRYLLHESLSTLSGARQNVSVRQSFSVRHWLWSDLKHTKSHKRLLQKTEQSWAIHQSRQKHHVIKINCSSTPS